VQALDALARQKTSGACELILVCDTITDGTLELVHSHPLAVKWTVVEIHHPGRGLAQAYNIGWKAARSEYVFFMHSDCYPVSDDAMLRHVACLDCEKALAVQPLVDIPQEDWDTMSFWDRVTSSQFRNSKPRPQFGGKFDLVPRDTFDKVGPFDEQRFFSAVEDSDMVERLLSAGRLATSDVVVIHAHVHPPDAKFRYILRKQAQLAEGTGALFRKYWFSFALTRRWIPITALNATKLFLPMGLLIPPISPYCAVLLVLVALYYARWAMLTRDWRVAIIPLAVPLMFAVFGVGLIRGFIAGRQTFDYIKPK
jgi:GT2 family glycosyltransferase